MPKTCVGNITVESLVKYHKTKICQHLSAKMGVTWEEAEDITMDAIMKAHLSMHQFDGKHSIATWLYRIAINRAIDLIRKKKSKPIIISLDDDTKPQSFEVKKISCLGQHHYVGLREDHKTIRKIVYSLDEKYRTVIILFYFNRLSYSTIAESLNLPLGTVKGQIHRAKHLLKPKLEHARIKY